MSKFNLVAVSNILFLWNQKTHLLAVGCIGILLISLRKGAEKYAYVESVFLVTYVYKAVVLDPYIFLLPLRGARIY